MNNYKIFCMCLKEHHLTNLKKLKYIPVGLGKERFSEEWMKDDSGENISHKNSNYGEYTFYYWFWKNMLKYIKDGSWVGFTGYRYHWSQNNKLKSEEITKLVNKNNFENYIMKKIPKEWNNFDCVLGEKIFINKWKTSKILKYAKKKFFLNPKYFLKKNQNIKLHFDVFHGDGNIERAINCLNAEEKFDFKYFIESNGSFNRENLFFCRSNKLMDAYFNSVFTWLEKCEKIFGFNLNGYGMKRIYAFLAERYLSYWFKKYSKPLEWPIFFFDTNKHLIEIK